MSKQSQEPVYFWRENIKRNGSTAVFSQWHMQDFTGSVNSIHDLSEAIGENLKLLEGQKFNCREQWMMALKALLFANGPHEKHNLKVYHNILETTNARDIKNLGREVKGFSEEVWVKWRFPIVVNGNYLQFSQDEDLNKILLDTGDKLIVEASPYDKIWGIGYTAEAAKANRDKWPGKHTRLNLLGFALMEVRKALS